MLAGLDRLNEMNDLKSWIIPVGDLHRNSHILGGGGGVGGSWPRYVVAFANMF